MALLPKFLQDNLHVTHTRDHLTPQASVGLVHVQLRRDELCSRDIALVQTFLCGDGAVPSPAVPPLGL